MCVGIPHLFLMVELNLNLDSTFGWIHLTSSFLSTGSPLQRKKIQHKKGDLCTKTSNAFEKIKEKPTPKERWTLFYRSVPESLSISTQDVSTLWTLSKIAIGHPLLPGDHHFSQFHAFPRTEAGHLKVSIWSEQKLNWWDFGWKEHFDIYILFVHVSCHALKGWRFHFCRFSTCLGWFFGCHLVHGLSFLNQILLRFSASGQEMGGSILFKQRRDHPLGKITFFFGWTNIWVHNFCYKEGEHHIAEEFWLNYSAIKCCQPPDELCREVEFFSQFFWDGATELFDWLEDEF